MGLIIKEAICLSRGCLVNPAGNFQGRCTRQVLHFLLISEAERKMAIPLPTSNEFKHSDLSVPCSGAPHTSKSEGGRDRVGGIRKLPFRRLYTQKRFVALFNLQIACLPMQWQTYMIWTYMAVGVNHSWRCEGYCLEQLEQWRPPGGDALPCSVAKLCPTL